MKIVKLVITGFGPYAARQELDFDIGLDGASMFVISGNTGAGKTTIFDAIAYALFGEASGTGRDGSSLRSDFADATVQTEVELRFSLRGNEYTVKRSPAYERAKQRGTGTTKKDATAELTLPDGKVRTGAKDVTAEMEQILGLTADQFRQLVMIPQGEFRRFLGADASQKEEIFRKIFGTDVYVRIQNIAKERAKRIADESEQVRHDRRESVRKFMPGENDAELIELISAADHDMVSLLERFGARIAADKKEEAECDAGIVRENESIERLNREHADGENINRDLDDLEAKRKEYLRLESLRTEFEKKEARAEKARKALTVRIHEKQLQDKKKEAESNDWAITMSEKKIAEFEKRTSNAEVALTAQKERDSERTVKLNRIKELEALKTKSDSIKTACDDVTRLEKFSREIGSEIALNNDGIARNEKEITECETRLNGIASLKEKKNILESELKSCEEMKEKSRRLVESAELWLADARRHSAIAESFQNIEKEYHEKKSAYEHLERMFMLNQAGILARDLADGSPCPVCGSTVHPKKAVCADTAVSEESLRKSRDDFESSRIEHEKNVSELTSLKKNMETIFRTSISLIAENISAEPTFETISSLLNASQKSVLESDTMKSKKDAEIRTLAAEISKENEYVAKRDALRKQVVSLREVIAKNQKEMADKAAELGNAKARYDTLKADFGGTVRGRDELDIEIKKIMSDIEIMKNELEAAETSLNKSRGVLDSERGNLSALGDRKVKVAAEIIELMKGYKDAIESAGFSDEKEYHSAIINESDLALMENEIKTYRLSFEKAGALCSELEKRTKEMKRVDLSGIENRMNSNKVARDKLNERKIALNVRISNNEKIADDCRRCTAMLEKTDAEYLTIGHVSKVLNGDNPRRISFERYVLAAYFDDIISAANIRFRRMTGGRFELMRKTETGDKRKALGLEMEVYDNYTGRARGVSTLSGGESFKASLCLALGMADVVQSHAGGIQLDTMFIDEGFGTLDPESLDNAIESLMELRQSGRLVGIISHVPELKERVGARLEVTATEKGSRAAFEG